MENEFEAVTFISVESGDDWIVSFFVATPTDPTDGRSIILLRDKKWEHLIPEMDKGVKVSDEEFSDDPKWDDNYLESIRLGDTTAEIKSRFHRHKLDLRQVKKSEIRSARKVLKKMNFDRRFKLNVA